MSTFWRVSAFRSKMLAYFDYYCTIILTSKRRRNWWNRGQNSCASIFGTSWWYIKSYNNGTWMNLLDRASCLTGAHMKYASHLSKLHANSCYRILLIFSQSPSSSLATDEISKPLIQVPCNSCYLQSVPYTTHFLRSPTLLCKQYCNTVGQRSWVEGLSSTWLPWLRLYHDSTCISECAVLTSLKSSFLNLFFQIDLGLVHRSAV